MSLIKKLLYIICILFVSIYTFSFEVSDLSFGEKILKGTSKSKEYILTNNTKTEKIYQFEIEEKNKNIKISPNVLKLASNESKKFTIKILANDLKGEHQYFLVIRERSSKKIDNAVALNKKIRILQEYTIE